MERKTVAKGLLVSALACVGFFFAGHAQAAEATKVQGTQSTRGAAAATGAALGGNASNFAGGPTAAAAGGASSQQLGNNTAKVSQTGTAKTGDPVAGGQVTGVVGDNATVQNSNSAIGVAAVSGPAAVVNANGGKVGPTAVSLGPSQTAQSGSNSLDLSQSGTTSTGDAVAGGQVTGIVGGGTHMVQNQNNCLGCVALSAPTAVVNLNGAFAGPTAASLAPAQAGQVGDNEAVISQSSNTKTGDAVSGGQVTGTVGGSAAVQNSNSCLGCLAASFPAFAFNVNAGATGPAAASIVNSQTSQSGDNSLDLSQNTTGSTGDAVSGSQVTGLVGDANGFLSVMNQQASRGDAAFSGPVVAANLNAANGGPMSVAVINAQSSQNGDNNTVVAQSNDGKSGDALAGAQISGGVGGDVSISGTNSAVATIALSAPVIGVNASTAHNGPMAAALLTSSASQHGDNTNSLDQTVTSETGDAVSGGQVAGAVASGDATVFLSNSSRFALAASSPAVGVNAGAALGGPFAAGVLNAQSQQDGRNDVATNQSVTTQTGDAVSGGQTVGTVSGGDSTISAQNSSFATAAFTSPTVSINAPVVFGSPVALGVLNANASQLGENTVAISTAINTTTGDAVSGGQVLGAVSSGDVKVMNTNNATLAISASGPAVAGNAYGVADGPVALALLSASASQNGDTNLTFNQKLDITSGDAVAGAAVVGATASGDISVMGSNSATATAAFSGAALAANAGFINGGPVAAGILNAQTQQAGSNHATIVQQVSTTSGDAVSGSQITGAVSNNGDVSISVQNSAFLTLALSGPSAAANAGLTHGGPLSLGLINANASQFGGNSSDITQGVTSTSGDAVSGAQINGAVANGSDVTVQGSNSAIATLGISGITAGVNAGVQLTGPDAISAVSGSASQFGSNDMGLDQSLSLKSGDAVSGSQITGVVAGSDGTVTISNQNSAIASVALSGPAIGPNLDFSVGGPMATGLLTAQAQQTGDNSLDYAQALSVTSGDAVAGGQVNGIVGGNLVPVQDSNSATGVLGLSGVTFGFNNAGGGLTPTAVSLISARVQQAGGSNLNGSQNLDTNSGDAVSGGQVGGRVSGSGSTTSGSSAASTPGLGTTGITTTGMANAKP